MEEAQLSLVHICAQQDATLLQPSLLSPTSNPLFFCACLSLEAWTPIQEMKWEEKSTMAFLFLLSSLSLEVDTHPVSQMQSQSISH